MKARLKKSSRTLFVVAENLTASQADDFISIILHVFGCIPRINNQFCVRQNKFVVITGMRGGNNNTIRLLQIFLR